MILSLPGAPVRLLKLKGLDEKALYRESESGEVFGGDELMYSGISIPLKKEDFRSEMYLFNKITEEENER